MAHSSKTLVHGQLRQQPGLLQNPRWAVLYLAILTIAECLVAFGAPLAGLYLHGFLLILLAVHATIIWQHPLHHLLMALALAPLIRILSLAMPLAQFPLQYWFVITAIPLFVASLILARTLGYSPNDIGLSRSGIVRQGLIGLTGIVLGVMEYFILKPAPLVPNLRLEVIWLPALILLICTGFLEELIFRGIMQQSAISSVGKWGLVLVAIAFAALHIGYRSIVDFFFVLFVALVFGWIVLRTKSIIGVTVSHGLVNIMLFMIMPYLAVSSEAALRNIAPPSAYVVVPTYTFHLTYTSGATSTPTAASPNPTREPLSSTATPIAPTQPSVKTPTASAVPATEQGQATVGPRSTPSPAPSIVARASVEHTTIAQGGTQTIYLLVKNNRGGPVAGVRSLATLYYGAAAAEIEMQPTDANGVASASFIAPPESSGYVITVQINVLLEKLTLTVNTTYIQWW